MPTYAYQCDLCNFEFEGFRPMASRHAAATCTKCGGPSSLVMTAPAYVYVKGEKKPKPKEDPDWNYSLGCRNNDREISKRRVELEAKGQNVDVLKP